MKRFLVSLSLLSLIFYSIPVGGIPVAKASSPGSVVINEIAWMGSLDSTSDEWIELHNTTSSAIDLTGWSILDDGSTTYSITSGTIPANGYFLIEDSENATDITADIVIPISLGNSGDSLSLIDDNAQVIDTVNTSSGAWYAGDNTSKATMERIDPLGTSEDSANWANAVSGNGATGQLGSAILGTPGSQNSVFTGANPQSGIAFETLSVNPVEGDTFTISIDATNMTDITSYGFDILYDATMLEYVSSSEGDFLSENGLVATSFNEGLENNNPGKIIMGGTRINVPQTGVSGNGTICTLNFHALQDGSTTLVFDNPSFIKDTSGDISLSLNSQIITTDPQAVDPATNLIITESSNRYELNLAWSAPSTGADSYKIMRKDVYGNFVEIGTSTQTNFIDSQNLIPTHLYEYEVIAIKGALESSPLLNQASDSRGIQGDNTRSDRVDGRDLDNLARHYTLAIDDTNFDPLIDTTYDGIIDGSDLIDIGANWAITY